MRPKMMVPTVGVLAVGFAAGGASAQSVDVTGEWAVTFDAAVRTRGAEVIEVYRRGTAELRLEQRGDSVTGRWIQTLRDGRSMSRPVSGTVRGDTVSLATERWSERVGGRAVPTRFTWTGALVDGELRGTMYMRLGDRPAPPRRWEARRT